MREITSAANPTFKMLREVLHAWHPQGDLALLSGTKVVPEVVERPPTGWRRG